jgi:hypothetical protein
MGRKNWLFCWTEIGAKYVGILDCCPAPLSTSAYASHCLPLAEARNELAASNA